MKAAIIAGTIVAALLLAAPASAQTTPTTAFAADASETGVISLLFWGAEGSVVEFFERVGDRRKRLGRAQAAAGVVTTAADTQGFSSEWLALREPADARARDAGLSVQLAQRLLLARRARAESPVPARFIDLACGTGANLRYLAPPLALLGIVAGLVLGAIGFWPAYLLPSGYVAAVVAGAAVEGRSLPVRAKLALPLVFGG